MYNCHSQKCLKLVFKTNYCLMQVKSIAECSEHSAILSTFFKLPFVIKIFVLSIFEWPFYTGFTVHHKARTEDKTSTHNGDVARGFIMLKLIKKMEK